MPTAEQDVEAVKTVMADWIRVAEKGDAEGYGAHITDDFIYLGPGAPPVAGKATVVPWVAGFFSEWRFAFPEWTTEEVIISGDIAIHRMSGIAVMTPKAGGEVVRLDRKYVDVLRRGPDGQWRAARHMYNQNN